jgi:hypothetical protein
MTEVRTARTVFGWAIDTDQGQHSAAVRRRDVTLCHDGAAVGMGRAEATQPLIFSADVTIKVDYGHFIDPEERYRIAMAIQ